MITASIVTYKHHFKDIEPVLRSLAASPVDKVFIIDHSYEAMSQLENELDEFMGNEVAVGRFSYIRRKNNGYGGGHNVALREAINSGSKYHLVVNPDVWFGKEVIPTLVSHMDEHDDVAQMMPKVLFPDGKTQRLAKLLPTPADIIGRFCFPERLIRRRNAQFELVSSGFAKVLDVPYLSGCFMFLRVSVLQEIGLFDEHFFMYAEDIDMTRRIHQKYKTLFYPEVSIFHKFNRLSHRNLRLLIIHVWNIVLYFNKWGWLRDAEREQINQNVLHQITVVKTLRKIKKID